METQIFAPEPKDGEPWDVAVIGSGPAALTAAIYTTRGALSTLILGGEAWGGQLMLTTEVDNYPALPGILGPDLMAKMREHSLMFGAHFMAQDVKSVDFSKRPFRLMANSQWLIAKSVIIATGASTLWLDAPGVKELIGRGISSCAPCDAPFFKDREVAVIGGGDSAMEEALTLTKYAKRVTIIHRRDTFRASFAMQKKVLSNLKINVLWNQEVVGVKGESRLKSVSLKNNKTGEISEMALDGLFIAIGHKPESDIFRNFVKIDAKGYITVDDHTKTNIQGVFVAGDVHDHHYKQAITAAGFGCMAALDTIAFLEENR